jgi:hypothetical protein
MFRFFPNELQGQSKRDASFEILIPDRLTVDEDSDEIYSTIVNEMEDNFTHDVKIVTENVYYPTARQANNDGKTALAWLYETEQGVPFMFKAMSMDPIMKAHFMFFAIDSPDNQITGGNSLPCVHGMLEINEQNPSPRVFNLEGSVLMQSFEGSIVSLIGQIYPEFREDALNSFEARKQRKKTPEKPTAYIRTFKELKN